MIGKHDKWHSQATMTLKSDSGSQGLVQCIRRTNDTQPNCSDFEIPTTNAWWLVRWVVCMCVQACVRACVRVCVCVCVCATARVRVVMQWSIKIQAWKTCYTFFGIHGDTAMLILVLDINRVCQFLFPFCVLHPHCFLDLVYPFTGTNYCAHVDMCTMHKNSNHGKKMKVCVTMKRKWQTNGKHNKWCGGTGAYFGQLHLLSGMYNKSESNTLREISAFDPVPIGHTLFRIGLASDDVRKLSNAWQRGKSVLNKGSAPYKSMLGEKSLSWRSSIFFIERSERFWQLLHCLVRHISKDSGDRTSAGPFSGRSTISQHAFVWDDIFV